MDSDSAARPPTRIMIVGAAGRMGQSLARLAAENDLLTVSALINRKDDYVGALKNTDVVIEFAKAEVTVPLARACAEAAVPIVIGSTGQTLSDRNEISILSKKLALVFTPNFSVGVNVLFHLVHHASQILGHDYDREIVEMHHRNKIDSPSGTARRLGEILSDASAGLTYDEAVEHGRVGQVGPREAREIGMHAIRGGDVVGDHTVIFAADGERVELSHKATNRDTFSRGALRAALWLRGKPPGLYTMADVLGLSC